MTNEDIPAPCGLHETMEYDAVVVGGGPGGRSAAIRMKQLAAERGRSVSVLVLETSPAPGAPVPSGALIPKA